MQCRPWSLGGKEPTGAVPTKPSAAVLRTGKSPCQTFILCSPPGSSSSPHGNAFALSPPRAANSHSASVGSLALAQAQYAFASSQETCTTGWSTRSSIEECGPSGWLQPAPSTLRHQGACKTPSVGGKSSGSSPAKTNDHPNR